MAQYKCITGGLVLNQKPIPFGKLITADRNPAEGHFVLVEEVEKPKRQKKEKE